VLLPIELTATIRLLLERLKDGHKGLAYPRLPRKGAHDPQWSTSES